MSGSRGAYSRRPSADPSGDRWETCHPHGFAAGFLLTSRKQLFEWVRTGCVPGPILVGGRIRWPYSLLMKIRDEGLSLPGTYENDPRKRPTLAAYRAAVCEEDRREAKRLMETVQNHAGKVRRRRKNGGAK